MKLFSSKSTHTPSETAPEADPDLQSTIIIPETEAEPMDEPIPPDASDAKRVTDSKLVRVAVITLLLAILAALSIFFLSVLRDTLSFAPADSTPEIVQTTPPVTTEDVTPQSTAIPAASSAPTVTPQPTPEGPLVILEKYAADAKKNPDMFGWIKIEDTVIDYPVMHTPDDPEKYLYKNFNGIATASGSLFLDAKCSPDSDNLIIYGHNIKNGTMFNSILKYEQIDYFNAHPVIKFDTLYKEQEYEVMSAFYDRVYYKTEDVFKFYQFIDAEDEEDFNSSVQTLKDKSIYDTGVTAEYGDQLIMLVTCAYHRENGRFVVVARKSA